MEKGLGGFWEGMEGMEGMEAVAHNPPALKTRMGFNRSSSNSEAVGHKTRMGFNLIEAAIVLGVVGFVLGGIWVGAATVYENYKVNKTVEGIFTTARNIQNLISLRDAEALGVGADMTSAVEKANVFPQDWVTVKGLRNIFGSTVSAQTTFEGPTAARFGIAFGGGGSSGYPNVATCAKLVLRASSIMAQAGVSGVNVGTEATGNNLGSLLRIYVGSDLIFSFPVSLSNATQACAHNSDGNNHVTYMAFTFSYTRTN